MAYNCPQDYSSKISFAPDTNFEEGFRTRRISSNAGLFNIRKVDNGKPLCQSAPGIPAATATDTSTDHVDSRAKDSNSQRLPKIDSKDLHFTTILRNFPAPTGLDIPTFCAYVRQDKPLLDAAKTSLVKASQNGLLPRLSWENTVSSRFPPISNGQPSLVGTDQNTSTLLKKKRAREVIRNYGSLDSLNLYLSQSSLNLNEDNIDVFMPYRHVPNLAESRRRSRTFLQDNERIKMLQPRCKTDDFDSERLEAYKLPQGDALVQEFIASV